MHVKTLALSPAGCKRNSRKPAMQSRPWFALLALSCLLVFTASALAQQNNTINTVAGQLPTNAIATLAAIPNPTGVAEDANGNYYVASQFSYSVFKVSSSGALSTFAGVGIFGFSGDGRLATTAALSSPVAVGVDNNSGKVYIVDANRIRVVTTDGKINTFAGNGKLCSPNIALCGDNGPANGPNVEFYAPQGIYVDGAGNIFIADTGSDRIRFINTTGGTVVVAGITVPAGYIVTVAGNGLTCNGPTDACGDGGSSIAQGADGARLDLEQGVATDAQGNIYIGDTRDQRIRCVANVAGGCPNTAFPNTIVGEIVTYAGSGVYCPDPRNSCNDGQAPLLARFHNPTGLWVDSAGNLYVADQWDYKVREVTVAACKGGTPCVTTVAGTGNWGYGGDGGKAIAAELDGPLGVVFDAAGNLTIADSGNNRIRQVSKTIINTIAGGGSIGDGGPATAANLADPVNVAWDATGSNYYIADAANNRIRQVTANGTITTVAGTGQPSYWDPGNWGDGASALLANLNSPNGVAIDASGNIYIADSLDSVVRAVNMQSTATTILGIAAQPGDIVTVAGSGLSCENPTALCGDDGPATGSGARITYPSQLALDGHGNLYISDYYDHRVREVLAVAGNCGAYTNLKVGYMCTIAGTGKPGNTGDGGPATQALLHNPDGVAADAAGNVYIADSLNNRVRCVIGATGGCGDSSGKKTVGTIVDYAYTGKATFTGNNGPALAATRPIPQQLSLDPAGNLFVGGGAVLLVQRIDAINHIVITVAGNPNLPNNLGFAGDGGPSTSATLDNLGLAVNANGNLLISDQGNNRIRQVDLVPVAQLAATQLNFPPTLVGHTNITSVATANLANIGLASLPLGTVTMGGTNPGDFLVAANSCITQVSPQSGCSVAVRFKPTQTGTRTATLTINTSLGAQNVTLTGTGQ